MSKQALPVLEAATMGGCCAPISTAPIDATAAADLSAAFKALGDPIRLQLMSMIASAAGGEACVCDLTPAFNVSGPTISHHLKILREAGLIDGDRRGTWIYYRPVAAKLADLSALLNVGVAVPA